MIFPTSNLVGYVRRSSLRANSNLWWEILRGFKHSYQVASAPRRRRPPRKSWNRWQIPPVFFLVNSRKHGRCSFPWLCLVYRTVSMLNEMLGLSKVMQSETVKIGWSDDVWFHDAWFTQGGKEKNMRKQSELLSIPPKKTRKHLPKHSHPM